MQEKTGIIKSEKGSIKQRLWKKLPAVCPLCGTSAKVSETDDGIGMEVVCTSCGKYITAVDLEKEEGQTQCCIFYYLTKNKLSHASFIPYFHRNPSSDNAFYFQGNIRYYTLNIATIENLFPQSFTERIDMSLINLARICGGISDRFNYWAMNPGKNNPLRLGCFIAQQNDIDGKNEIKEFFDLLCEMQYITDRTAMGSMVKTNSYKITASGWMKIQQIQEQSKVLQQGFIAMSFSPEMTGARDSIARAIESCGYISCVIDVKEHNNQIVPEIFHEIKRSKFVIADLTGHKNGVYYEAGYAEALGKEVILTCQKASKEIQRPHFDVAQKNTIFWTDEDDLCTRLINRIDATVGKIE